MNILLGISSGIAACRSEKLIQKLQKAGNTVRVMMTENTKYMVSAPQLESLTKNKVYKDLFSDHFDPESILKSRRVEHIDLSTWANIILIAPATASIIAKLAGGICDDYISTTVLAASSPIIICPSMNTLMWSHAATQKNIDILRSFGYIVMDPTSGLLACGTTGIGRLPRSEAIIHEIEKTFRKVNLLKNVRVLVTAGGTAEPIDSVRSITNRSTGKMGLAIAEEAALCGAKVTLLLSATSTVKPSGKLNTQYFDTSKSLSNLIEREIKNIDVIFHIAAVSDFSTDSFTGKYPSDLPLKLTLIPQEKIVSNIKKWNPKVILVSAKAVFGISKNIKKECANILNQHMSDAVILNDVSRTDVGFGKDENEVHLYTKKGDYILINKKDKKVVSSEIIDFLLEHEVLR